MIEVRNIVPDGGMPNVSINSNIEFDLVALDDYTITIASLTVGVEMESIIIPGTTGSLEYNNTSPYMTVTGGGNHYHIVVNPEIPFDEKQMVTIVINVSGLTNLSAAHVMDEVRSDFTTMDLGIISDFKYAFINSTEKIPVYSEKLRANSTTSPTIFESAYPRWNDDRLLKVRLNKVIIEPTDATYPYTVNFENGSIEFDTALAFNDEVNVGYSFRFFSEEEINSFFQMASALWNVAPPFGGPRTIHNAGFTIRGVLMVGASLFAYRELMFRLAFQETRIIFDNASWGEGWTKVSDIFKSQHDMTEKAWNQSLEWKKAQMPNNRPIVQPSYTLPGGRSRMFRYLYK